MTTPNFKTKSFEDYVNDFLVEVNKLNNHRLNSRHIAKYNKRFVKIILQTDYNDNKGFVDSSVYAFIVRNTDDTRYRQGDLLKAASWNTPAKHARGNIIDGTARFTEYGPAYLR